MCASGFFQWRTSGASGAAPLVNLYYYVVQWRRALHCACSVARHRRSKLNYVASTVQIRGRFRR